MTKRENFNAIKEIVKDNADLVAFIDHELELLDKKSSKGNSKKSAEVEANVELVFEALKAVGKAVTVTELIASADNEVGSMTNQRVSAYLKKLTDAERVVKSTEKKVSRFAVAE